MPEVLADRPRPSRIGSAGDRDRRDARVAEGRGRCLTRRDQLGLAEGRLGGYLSPLYKYTRWVNTWEEKKNKTNQLFQLMGNC